MVRSVTRLSRLVLALLAAGTASFGATPALALSHYFTMGGTLYRSENGAAPTSVPITNSVGGTPLNVPSLAFDPSGVLWGFNNLQTAQRGFYTINPTTGSATQQFDLSGSSREVNTFDFRVTPQGTEILAFVNRSGGSQDYFERLSLTGVSNGTFNTLSTFPGFIASGYVASSDAIFATNGVDYDLRSYDPDGDIAGGTFIGDLGVTWSQGAGALFGDDLYFGYRPGQHNNGTQEHQFIGLRFGRVNLATGVFTQDFAFTEAQTPFAGAMGYAVIPEPGTMLLVTSGLAGLAARRRRS